MDGERDTPAARREPWPITPATLVTWAEEYQAAYQAGAGGVSDRGPDLASLLRLLADARLTAKTATAVEEWLLMTCRREGATLEQLAEITGASRKYVRGPDKRLGRLAEQYGTPQARLSALRRRIIRDEGEDDDEEADA